MVISYEVYSVDMWEYVDRVSRDDLWANRSSIYFPTLSQTAGRQCGKGGQINQTDDEYVDITEPPKADGLDLEMTGEKANKLLTVLIYGTQKGIFNSNRNLFAAAQANIKHPRA